MNLPNWDNAAMMLAGVNPMGRSAAFLTNQFAEMARRRLQDQEEARLKQQLELQRQRMELEKQEMERRKIEAETQRKYYEARDKDAATRAAREQAEEDRINRKRNAMRDVLAPPAPGRQYTNPATGMAEFEMPGPAGTPDVQQQRELDVLKEHDYDEYSKRIKDIESAADRDATRKALEDERKLRHEEIAEARKQREAAAAATLKDKQQSRADRASDKSESRTNREEDKAHTFWKDKEDAFGKLEQKYAGILQTETNQIMLNNRINNKLAAVDALKSRTYADLANAKRTLEEEWQKKAVAMGYATAPADAPTPRPKPVFGGNKFSQSGGGMVGRKSGKPVFFNKETNRWEYQSQ